MLIKLNWNQFKELGKLLEGAIDSRRVADQGYLTREGTGSKIKWDASGVEIKLPGGDDSGKS